MSDTGDDPSTDAAPAVPPSADTLRVQLRGIYTTALTALLHGTETGGCPTRVVQASEPIRNRFEASFPVEPADATVDTTDERQGVGVSGAPWAVARLRDRLTRVGRDAFAWPAALPRGGVYQGIVTDTLGGGAVVDCGPEAGYLPYDDADDYVEEGDTLLVQVWAPRAPWDDDRPGLATDLVVEGELVDLRRGGSGRATSEAAQMAEMLQIDVPDGWSPLWSPAADDADLDALGDALGAAVDRAETVEAALDGCDPDTAPGPVVEPFDTVWCWFGRESRFGLDEHRRDVTTTMPGHHRTKAAAYAASAAVDFAEAVCGDGMDGEFPFAAVTRQFGPREGDRLALHHGKPDGRLITLGRGEVTDYDPAGEVTLRREMSAGGTYDALGVERRAGDVAITKLKEGRWWYPTIYRGEDGRRRGTYVNVCTPVELFPDAARYVDLHVDVVKDADGEVRRVDDDELDEAVERGYVSEPLAEQARQVATAVENAL